MIMKGIRSFSVETPSESFFITLRRQFTIIQGDSGAGKSFLYDSVSDYNRGVNKDIILKSDTAVVTVDSIEVLKDIVDGRKERICIIDEAAMMYTDEFFNCAKHSNVYFVLISHGDIESIPYSVKEIFYLRRFSTRNKDNLALVPEFKFDATLDFEPDLVIVEDSNSGFDFYNLAFSCDVVSASGKSNIPEYIKNSISKGYRNILVVADGAAFGSCAFKTRESITHAKVYGARVCVFLPESFEYMVLRSSLCRRFCSQDVLDNTYNYADTKNYYSWEDFYTRYLVDKTSNDKQFSKKMHYDKHKLRKYYVDNYDEILRVFWSEV